MNLGGLVAWLKPYLFRLSLFQRIVIGNALIIVFGAIGGTLVTRHLASQAKDGWLILLFSVGGILISLTINFLIVIAALRPLRDLGRLAERLQSGDSFGEAPVLSNPDPYTIRLADTLQSLFIQLEARNRELRALSERAINTQEEQRRAIARSLHDETGQALSMLIIQLDRIDERLSPRERELKQQLAEARALASASLTELRRILSGLRPAILDDLGLASAIRWYARTHLEQAGIITEVKTPPTLPDLLPELATTLFRISQEAVNNIERHAGARSAQIVLTVGEGQMRLLVEDDGKGFDPQRASWDAVELQRLGLLGMRERAELLGGQVRIDSAPGKGTRLEVTIPLGETRGKNPHFAG